MSLDNKNNNTRLDWSSREDVKEFLLLFSRKTNSCSGEARLARLLCEFLIFRRYMALGIAQRRRISFEHSSTMPVRLRITLDKLEEYNESEHGSECETPNIVCLRKAANIYFVDLTTHGTRQIC